MTYLTEHKYSCDRCGTTTTLKLGRHQDPVGPEAQWRSVSLGGMSGEVTFYSRDLCPKCVDAFECFVKITGKA